MSLIAGTKKYVNAVAYDMQLTNGEKPYALVSLRVVDGPDTGRNLSKRLYLTEKAKDISFKQLRALGWTGTKLSRAMADGLGTRKATVLLIVEQNENTGKLYEEVKGIYEPKPMRARVENPVETSDLDAFDALFESDAACIQPETELSDFNRAPAVLPPAVRANGQAPKTNPNDLGF